MIDIHVSNFAPLFKHPCSRDSPVFKNPTFKNLRLHLPQGRILQFFDWAILAPVQLHVLYLLQILAKFFGPLRPILTVSLCLNMKTKIYIEPKKCFNIIIIE